MLKEIKNEHEHYFIDENGIWQGECILWYNNKLSIILRFFKQDVKRKLLLHCFYLNGDLHGEYKHWYENGQLSTHCFYVNGNLHGECKSWHDNGQLATHCFYSHYVNITNQVKALVNDINNITDEEKFIIKLNFGITLC